MKITYEAWSPVEDMPSALIEISIGYEKGDLIVSLTPNYLPPALEPPRIIRVLFHQVLAYAVYEDMIFSLGNIAYGLPGVSTFVVKNSDWPGSHALFEQAGYKNVTHYRFGSRDNVVDVVAAGFVEAEWVERAVEHG